MYKLKAFIYSLLLVTTPSLAYPHAPPQISQKLNEKPSESILSYDEIIHLLDELESGELKKRSTSEDLQKITLLKQGFLIKNT